jgi:Uma2 family endonuclease
MTHTLTKKITFEEFIEWFPNDGKRYELHDGVIIEMPPPTGDHEDIIGFLVGQIANQYLQMGLSYRIPKTAFVKTPNNNSTYSPDILLINHDNLINEPLWKKQSTLSSPESVPLVVEVVSTNWRDDYYTKFANYELMGIPEYWIVDYAALGGRDFIGNPKQPAIFVCQLVDGEYVKTLFRNNDLIISPTFPQLQLTAQQIFDAAL